MSLTSGRAYDMMRRVPAEKLAELIVALIRANMKLAYHPAVIQFVESPEFVAAQRASYAEVKDTQFPIPTI